MASGDVVWDIISKSNCCFQHKRENNVYCSNKFSLDGLCNRTVCPLANYRYATVKIDDDIVYLYIREAERMPYPAKHWERIKLREGVNDAVKQIDTHLINWPKHIVKKVKQRYAMLKKTIKRERQLELKRVSVSVARSRKVERNETRKEMKALKAANIEKSIEAELLDKLSKNREFCNINEAQYKKYLKETADEEELEEMEEDEEEEEEYEFDSEEERELVEASDIESEEDIEDLVYNKPTRANQSAASTSKSRPKIVIQEEDSDSD